jgi:hypothetical protein
MQHVYSSIITQQTQQNILKEKQTDLHSLDFLTYIISHLTKRYEPSND